jgi:starvation-inducible outer membrane lipoprotein
MRQLRSYEYGLLIFILAFGLRACSTIKKNMGTHQEASSQSQRINSSSTNQQSPSQSTGSSTDPSTDDLMIWPI